MLLSGLVMAATVAVTITVAQSPDAIDCCETACQQQGALNCGQPSTGNEGCVGLCQDIPLGYGISVYCHCLFDSGFRSVNYTCDGTGLTC